MPELSQKLDRFTAAILAEATAETQRALAALQLQHDQAYSAAEDEILADVYRYMRGQISQIKSEAGRSVSRHMLEIKRTLYLRRGAIAQEVFGLVREKIVAFTATEEYAAQLSALFSAALEALAGAEDVRVYLRSADEGCSPLLASTVPQRAITFLPGAFTLGGLIAESPALGRRLDATFDTAMGELDGHFAELFGLSLSAE